MTEKINISNSMLEPEKKKRKMNRNPKVIIKPFWK